jgi:hypothetical protein
MLAGLILITCQSTTAIEIVRFGLIATPHHRSLWVDFGQSRQAEIGQKRTFCLNPVFALGSRFWGGDQHERVSKVRNGI